MKILDNPFALADEILQIIKESKNFLFLVSPYTQFERNEAIELKVIKDAIIDSLKGGVNVNFITHETNAEKKLKFLNSEGCKIHFIPKLHSKIYCNESRALITSMNLILTSILNNKEIGITVNKVSEPNEYNTIISYVKEFTKRNLEKNDVEVSQRKENVYVLKLENNKWYVGKTSDRQTLYLLNTERLFYLTKRLKEQKSGTLSPWMQMNKIIGVEDVIEDGDLKTITLNYMKRYGWENVRGYAWSQWNMKNPPKELREYFKSEP